MYNMNAGEETPVASTRNFRSNLSSFKILAKRKFILSEALLLDLWEKMHLQLLRQIVGK